MKNVKMLIAIVGISLLSLYSCSKEETKNSDFKVRMTDAPADYAEVNMEIKSVHAFNAEMEEWIVLDQNVKNVNVVELKNGKEIELASINEIEAGVYSQLKIVFGTDNSIVIDHQDSEGEKSLELEYVASEEVIIDINKEYNGSEEVSILLDFNIPNSIHEENEDHYEVEPFITVMNNENTGVKGMVTGEGQSVVYLSNGDMTQSTYAGSNGEFLIKGVEDGMYLLTVETSIDGKTETKVVEVAVSAGTFTQVSLL